MVGRIKDEGDGEKIAFTSDRDGHGEIYIMDADGSNQINITKDLSGDRDPAWSPDGKKIAFVNNFSALRIFHTRMFI